MGRKNYSHGVRDGLASEPSNVLFVKGDHVPGRLSELYWNRFYRKFKVSPPTADAREMIYWGQYAKAKKSIESVLETAKKSLETLNDDCMEITKTFRLGNYHYKEVVVIKNNLEEIIFEAELFYKRNLPTFEKQPNNLPWETVYDNTYRKYRELRTRCTICNVILILIMCFIAWLLSSISIFLGIACFILGVPIFLLFYVLCAWGIEQQFWPMPRQIEVWARRDGWWV